MTDRPSHFRPGFRTLTPYLTVHDAAGLIAFMGEVFEARETGRTEEDGVIRNAALEIGDSMVEVSEARGEWPARPGSLHVYLKDVDEVYGRALNAGATSLHEPEDMPYGERGAALLDAFGNHWYLATYTGEYAAD
ncbi:MAG: VOC family protein [Acidobacteriota bacterium]